MLRDRRPDWCKKFPIILGSGAGRGGVGGGDQQEVKIQVKEVGGSREERDNGYAPGAFEEEPFGFLEEHLLPSDVSWSHTTHLLLAMAISTTEAHPLVRHIEAFWFPSVCNSARVDKLWPGGHIKVFFLACQTF